VVLVGAQLIVHWDEPDLEAIGSRNSLQYFNRRPKTAAVSEPDLDFRKVVWSDFGGLGSAVDAQAASLALLPQ
jgi:hypothetical protein